MITQNPKLKTQKYFLIIFSIIALFSFAFSAHAALVPDCGTTELKLESKKGAKCEKNGETIKITDYDPSYDKTCEITEVIPKNCTLCNALQVFTNVARFIFASLGGVAAIFFLWGGIGLIFNWGSAESVQQNKKVITGTLIGVLVVLLAWMLVNIIISILTTPVGPAAAPAFSEIINPFYMPSC